MCLGGQQAAAAVQEQEVVVRGPRNMSCTWFSVAWSKSPGRAAAQMSARKALSIACNHTDSAGSHPFIWPPACRLLLLKPPWGRAAGA